MAGARASVPRARARPPTDSRLSRTLFSIGHGTRPIDEFIAILSGAGVVALADVRNAPGSRRHPQFGQAALERSLHAVGIGYVHLRGLGGRREPSPSSPHTALRVAAFRGYADHMASDEFRSDYERFVDLGVKGATAFMCAETLWWRCHRRLIADRLTVDGWDVVHLLGPDKREPHRVWDVARVVDGRLVYDGGAIPLAAHDGMAGGLGSAQTRQGLPDVRRGSSR